MRSGRPGAVRPARWTVRGRNGRQAIRRAGKPPLARLFMLPFACAAVWGCIQGEPEKEHTVAGGEVARGAALVKIYGCGACHVIPGVEGAVGTVGPPLTEWSERQYIAGALLNTAPNLIGWIVDPQDVEPGTAMPDMGVTPEEARDIAAYLYTLGDPTALGPPHLFPARALQPGGSRGVNRQQGESRTGPGGQANAPPGVRP